MKSTKEAKSWNLTLSGMISTCEREKDVKTGFKGSFYELLLPGEGSLTFGALPGSKESMPTASPADA